MSKLKSFVFSGRTLLLTFFLVYFFRIFYVLTIIDPNSGQDAPSFSEDAQRIIENGIFTDLVHAPWWPVGYSWWVSFWWGLFGTDSRMLGLAQTTLLMLAQVSMYFLAKRIVTDQTAKVLAYIMLFNFALLSSSGQIMYETPMLSFLALAVYNLRSLILGTEWSLGSSAAAGLFFALAVLMHPSALAIAISMIVVAVWRNIPDLKRLASITVLLTLLFGGVGAQMLRNSIAGDGRGFTTTAFSNALLGGWGANNTKEAYECEKLGRSLSGSRAGARWDNPSRQICLYLVTVKDPSQLLEVAEFNSRRYWSPFVGILKGGGTWYHGFDFRRFINTWYKWWEGPYRTIDTILGYSWILTHLSLFLLGIRNFSRFVILPTKQVLRVRWFLLTPIIVSYATSLFTLGDTRHRMPIMLFYAFFVSIGIMSLGKLMMNLKAQSQREEAVRNE